MPKFLTVDEIYRIISRELPADAYADGSPTAFFTKADDFAVSEVLSTSYENMEVVYDNYFPQTVDEKIDDMEVSYFGQISASGVTLQERRDKIIAKIREQPDLTLWRIQTAILGYLPEGTPVQIVKNAFYFDHWQLNQDELNLNTYLGGGARTVLPIGSDYCSESGGNWEYERNTAYGYQVRIFGYTMSAELRAQVDALLTQIEPARDNHVIYDGLNLADYYLTGIVTPVDRADLIDCIYLDPASSTGYSGRVVE